MAAKPLDGVTYYISNLLAGTGGRGGQRRGLGGHNVFKFRVRDCIGETAEFFSILFNLFVSEHSESGLSRPPIASLNRSNQPQIIYRHKIFDFFL
jgi:hypothetical protein